LLAREQVSTRGYVAPNDEILYANLQRDLVDLLARLDEIDAARRATTHADRVGAARESADLALARPASVDAPVRQSSADRKAWLLETLRWIQKTSRDLAQLESSLLATPGGSYTGGLG